MSGSNDKFEREFEAFLREEDSQLAALYRKLPQPEPDARLDASVRSMARRALNPQLVATPRAALSRQRARWVPMLGAAAGVVLAAGIAWKIGPAVHDDREYAPSSDVITVHQQDAPAQAVEPPLSLPPPPTHNGAGPTPARSDAPNAFPAPASRSAAPAPAPAAQAAAPQKDASVAMPPPGAAEESGALSKTEGAAKPVAAPRGAPEAAKAQKRAAEMDAVERKQIMAAGAAQSLHDRDEAAAQHEDELKSRDDKAAGTTQDSRAASPSDELPRATTTPAAPPPATTRNYAAPPPPASMTATVPPPPPPEAVRESAPQPSRDVEQAEHERTLQAETATRYKAAPVPPSEARADAVPATANERAGGGADAAAATRAPQPATPPVPRSNDPNAKLYPEHWLANVRTMLSEGRRDDAVRSLAEFRRLYPDYRLPDDLRDVK